MSLALVAAGIVAFVLLPKLLKSDPVTTPEASPLVEVAVVPVMPRTDGVTIEADGTVVPYREINLAAEVAGRVDKREEVCRAGNFVAAGTLLFTIDGRDYELEVHRLEKELQQATVALEELAEEMGGAESLIEISRKQLALRNRESRRWEDLAEDFRNSADLEQAASNELAAEHALVTLQNRLQLLRISQRRLESAKDLAATKLERAKLDLARTEVVAPVDGVVVADTVEQDSFVQRGAPLLTLEDTSKVEVTCKLTMEDLYWLWDRESGGATAAEGNPASLAYDIPRTDVQVIYRLTGHNDREFVWAGALTRYDGIGLDPKTRTVPCRVVIDNPRQRVLAVSEQVAGATAAETSEGSAGGADRLIDPRSGPPALVRGMYVTVRFTVVPKTPLLEVPESALRPGDVVWVVRGGKLAVERVNFITLLPLPSGQPDVSDGDPGGRGALIYVDPPATLAAGDQVVVSPLSFVRTGREVRVMSPDKK
jgi:multidrug efflux pump subunit AcrA (membrane-fusion protein)